MEVKEKSIIKSEKGITLIALVVTIVVLLILAAVSISMLGGENGIITKAIEAKDETTIGEEKEKVQLAVTAAKTKNNWGEILESYLRTELDTNIGSEEYSLSKSGDKYTVTYTDSNRSYEIDANGNVTELGEANIIASIRIEGEKVTTPPLPSDDFSHTEGTVDTGYVIKDSNGNEFVWVPVDKNQKIKINVTSKENIDSISLTDPYGDEITLSDTDSLGKSYNNENVEPTINGTYKLKVTSGEENKTINLKVTSLYALRMWELELSEEELERLEEEMERDIEELEKEGKLEEALEQMGVSTVEELKKFIYQQYEQQYVELKNKYTSYTDTEDYTESVKDNGGFYIARYEASYENGNVVSKVSTTTRETSSTPLTNGMLWNYISPTDALSKSNDMYASSEFTSSLLTGVAWDRTLSWLEETGAVTRDEIIVCRNWANTADDPFSGPNGISNTGAYKETEKNRIYDLAGNLLEWTSELYQGRDFVERGTCWNAFGDFGANRRTHGNSWGTQFDGFRPCLFLSCGNLVLEQ